MSGIIGLSCRADRLLALATAMKRFGPTGGNPEWLVTAVWLCTGSENLLATPTVDVLGDGFVARSLSILSPGELVEAIDAELPDLAARLPRSGRSVEDRDAPVALAPPASLIAWAADPYSMSVLVRESSHAGAVKRVACALLFSGAGGLSLLVGTDPACLAIVLSDEASLIRSYREDCETLPLEDYIDLIGGRSDGPIQ